MATQELIPVQNGYNTPEPSSAPKQDTDTNGSFGLPEKLTTGLGWFSIGLGLTEIIAPRALAKLIGVPENTKTMRMMGLRELTAGIGILSTKRAAPWLWARVGGDAMDLAALAGASKSRHANGTRLGIAMGAVAGVTVLDAACAYQQSTPKKVRFTASTVINRSPEECYRFWHDIEKLPIFLDHLKSVRVTGERHSHWIAKGPGGKDLAWDAEITEDRPNEVIAWRSLEGADVSNSGRVRFEAARGGRGAIVRVLMEYRFPGAAGAVLTALMGKDPKFRVRKDLLRFKQLLETGEIATTEGQPSGRPSGATWLDRIARI